MLIAGIAGIEGVWHIIAGFTKFSWERLLRIADLARAFNWGEPTSWMGVPHELA